MSEALLIALLKARQELAGTLVEIRNLQEALERIGRLESRVHVVIGEIREATRLWEAEAIKAKP